MQQVAHQKENAGPSDVAALRGCLVLENDVAERGQ